jgi:hypothetical protein
MRSILPAMKLHRIYLTAAATLLWPSVAAAQAPPTAPLVLTQPSSARVAALGGAWVAGRDQDVIFHNPAQLVGVRTDFSVSAARYGDLANMASLTSAYTGGKLSFTLGWGVQVVTMRTIDDMAWPFTGDTLRRSQSLLPFQPVTGAQSAVATVGAGVLYKGFRIGAAGKYAADRTIYNRHAFLADLGVARNVLGGTVAVAYQNLGRASLSDIGTAKLPRQIAAGFSKSQAAGPLDLAIFTEVSHRAGWNSAAAGLEAGYSWIEGVSVTGRVGVRRPETTSEKPVSLGGALTVDRLTLEYALQMFDNSKRSHLVTVRWR